ncbi:MAG: hypothetical protein AB7Q16_11975 [Vicinamibacterales bacterium]
MPGTRCPRHAAALCALLLAAATSTAPAVATAQAGSQTEPGPRLSTRAQQEDFLAGARIVRVERASKGVTGTARVTLSNGTVTHEASVQTIDDSRMKYETPKGVEMNFKDSWRFNVAAYHVDRLLDLGMVPATVERMFQGKPASFTWWVDDVLMDEEDRQRRNIEAPSRADWDQQLSTVRLFDQLIANVDRNKGNLLIDEHWNMWMIDHSRAFRVNSRLRSPDHLTRAERSMLTRLRRLDRESLRTAAGRHLNGEEIAALLKRRDQIVAHFDKGGPRLLFDRPPRCC